jgi:DNA primase
MQMTATHHMGSRHRAIGQRIAFFEAESAPAIRATDALHSDFRSFATIERRKSAPRGKAYVDVMQNVKGHHVVPPYVLRAVPSVTVSTRLKWSELTNRLTPERFDLKSAPKRFESLKEDPMKTLMAPGR